MTKSFFLQMILKVNYHFHANYNLHVLISLVFPRGTPVIFFATRRVA